MREISTSPGVSRLPPVKSVQLVTVDRGLGTVDFQYLDPDGGTHELTMSLDEARRLYIALDSLADDA
jgi:hypothetical protein